MVSTIVRATLLAFLLLWFPAAAMAQSPAPQPAAAPADQLLKPEELEALVAPVALYPDNLLSLLLMASTYPLEVVQADRWVTANKNLKGEALKAAVDKQQWDESVKSLAATPDVLSMMSGKLDWTQKLGDAVLAQQPDVMDAIQRMRQKAQANDKLKSTNQQTVTVKQEANKQVVVIEPKDPNTVYVPYYDPNVVYGGWSYPEYPPYYFPPPGYIAGGIIATGIAFGAGYALGRWVSGGNYWGGGCNWGNNNINVNRPININNSGNNWQHNPQHRQGVRYSNRDVQNKFQGNRGGGQDRMDFRGRDGQQVLKPGDRAGDRAGDRGGDRAGDRAGNRPGAGDRAANRPGGGDRAGDRGGNRGGDRAGNRGGQQRPAAGNRPAKPAGGRDNALGNIQRGSAARAQSSRGQASLGARGGGGAPRAAMAGGGPRGGGAMAGGGGMRGGGGARGGGGRRSDIRLKHDIEYLGRLDSGLGFYRFAYVGEQKPYVGVMAQDVQTVMPDAVSTDKDGYLRVRYDVLGLKFQTFAQWSSSGGQLPTTSKVILSRISAATTQQTFATPEEAANALAAAARAGDQAGLLKVLGRDGEDIVSSGDETDDAATRQRFITAFDAKHRIVMEGDDKASLVLGDQDYVFPIPIVKKDGAWRLDTIAGRREILYRRIGRNELNTIETAKAYVDAQNEYAAKDRGAGVGAYAQRFFSTPGKKDGLYWATESGGDESPLGDLFARASTEGYGTGEGRTPYHGYYFKILKRQGRNAPGGSMDYVVRGKMIGGFALVAYPAQYGNSGVMTFVVNHDGTVYEKDLGSFTWRTAERMTAYDPDQTWRKVSDQPSGQ